MFRFTGALKQINNNYTKQMLENIKKKNKTHTCLKNMLMNTGPDYDMLACDNKIEVKKIIKKNK